MQHIISAHDACIEEKHCGQLFCCNCQLHMLRRFFLGRCLVVP